MPIKNKLIDKYILANRPLKSITFEFHTSQSAEEDNPCPCDGAVTLIIEGEGPPACEWGSEECPTNTKEPEPEPACVGDKFLNSVVAPRALRVELTDSRQQLANRLLADLVEKKR